MKKHLYPYCIVCVNPYVRTQGRDQEVCLICQHEENKKFQEEIRILTAKIKRRNEYVEGIIKKYKHYYKHIYPELN